ncbi:MAG TPA: GDSL-type esterase/lipase family protein [Baekduia sp.]
MLLPRLSSALFGALLACVLLVAALLAPGSASARITPADAAADVLVVGDSLAVGLRPSLNELLPGADIAWDARSGRTTPQGMVALRSALKVVHPKTVIVSLGTNDGPDGGRFADRIDRMLAATGPDTCVVWSDIYRPARKGPYAALNTTLFAEASRVKRLHLVDWLSAVTRRRVTLPDGLHPDAAGFAYRAKLIADAVKAHCRLPAVPQVVGDATTGGAVSP